MVRYTSELEHVEFHTDSKVPNPLRTSTVTSTLAARRGDYSTLVELDEEFAALPEEIRRHVLETTWIIFRSRKQRTINPDDNSFVQCIQKEWHSDGRRFIVEGDDRHFNQVIRITMNGVNQTGNVSVTREYFWDTEKGELKVGKRHYGRRLWNGARQSRRAVSSKKVERHCDPYADWHFDD